MALTFDDTQQETLLGALGLPKDTTDVATALAAVQDAATASTAEGAAPSAVAAAARRNGLEVLDTATAAALRREAAQGRQLAAAAAHEQIVNTVNDAIAKGKIFPSSRTHWEKLVAADPEMGKMLATIPNETAVPLTEVGHSAADVTANNDEWFY